MDTHIKQTAFLVLIILFFSCGNDDDAAINQNPEEFNVNVEVSEKGLGIRLTWDVPIDPDGDALIYDVMLGSSFVLENTTSLSHVFRAAAYNTTQSGTIIAKDGKGGERSISFTFTSSSLVNLPDANFESFLVNANIDTDGQVNGQMDYLRPLETTSLDVDATISGVGIISDLTGIESFANLENFVCNNQHINSLNISRNTKLERLACSNINVTSLDISNNTNLKFYTGFGNSITSIDFSKNLALTNINLDGNVNLTELDVTKNIALKELNCGGTDITTLDISQNIELTGLNCGGTNLTALDTSTNTKLRALLCFGNALASLDLSTNILLENLSCGVNNLSRLDLSANINLKTLRCHQNTINILNLSQNSQLQHVICSDNNLTSLNLKNGTSQNIQQFNARNNSNLTSICIDILVPVNPVLSGGVDTGVSFSTICN